MRFLRTVCTLIPMTFLLAACAHKPNAADNSSVGSFKNTQACKSNPFLQKYGCQLDRVEAAAEQNDADAEYALGYMYYYGIGTVRDQQTAVLWIQRAASQGQSLAMQAMSVIRKAQYPKMGGTAMAKKTPAKKTPAKVTTPNAVAKRVVQREPKPSYSEQHMLSAVKNHYTIQLMASHHLPIVKSFIADSGLGKKVGYYKTRFQNSDWYVAIYGDFSSVHDAKIAMTQLPLALQRAHPWVKSYRTVQKEILEHRVKV